MKKKSDINWKDVWVVIVTSLFLAILLNLFFDVSSEMKLSWKLEADATVTYQDLAATLLTGVGVLVTVLAVIIALVAMVGLRQLKVAVMKKAETVAREVAEKEAKEEAAQTAEKFMTLVKDGIIKPKDWGNEDSEYGD